MTQLNAYLSFDGTCAAAMRFYEKVLNGKIETMMTVAQTPMAAQMPPGSGDRIMHAYLTGDGFSLMAGDAMSGQPYEGMKGFSLTLSYATADLARGVFAALSEGGKVSMPLEKTFWADAFGMLVDRFGTPWTINGGMQPI